MKETYEKINRRMRLCKKLIKEYSIIILNGNTKVLEIIPIWCELYYFVDNDSTYQDPYCNLHPNKYSQDKLFFNLKGAVKQTNKYLRMDICCGEEGLQASILIKAGYLKCLNGNDKYHFCKQNNIALKVLEACGCCEQPNNYSITYRLVDRQNFISNKEVVLCNVPRVNLNPDSKLNGKEFYALELAYFDCNEAYDKHKLDKYYKWHLPF